MFKLQKNNLFFFIGISLFIILFDLILVKSLLYQENDQILTIGVTLDFVVVIPLLLYFLIYRKLKKNVLMVLPIALLGYIALEMFMPESGNEILNIVKYIILPLEGMFICFGIYKITQTIITFRRNRTMDSHPIEAFRKSMEATFNSAKLLSVLTHEISVLYYGIFAWRKKPYLQTDSTSFSYHTNSNWLITVLLISKLLIIEGAVIHILLMQWSHPVAWVLTIGNIYIVILLIADYRAMCLNPILVSKQTLRVQYGIQMLANIDLNTIESVSTIKFKELSKEELKTSFTPIAVEPNVLIRLKSEMTITRMFGKQQRVDHIYLFVDKPNEFQKEYHHLMDQQNQIQL